MYNNILKLCRYVVTFCELGNYSTVTLCILDRKKTYYSAPQILITMTTDSLSYVNRTETATVISTHCMC